MRQVFGETLAALGDTYPEMRVLDADVSTSTQTKIFKDRYPDRFYNFGIAEANMAAAAAGMATCGLMPVISTFAFLLSVRAMDSIHSLIAYNRLNVKIAGGYSGLSAHANGASHQSICDMAFMRAIPGMTVLAPSDEESTVQAIQAMLDHHGPVYLRLSRDTVKSLHKGNPCVKIGKVFEIIEGRDIGIITTGTTLNAALNAREILKHQGIDAGIIEAICVKPLDEETIIQTAQKYGCLATVEEHSIFGGLGDAVCSALCTQSSFQVLKIGLNDCFGQSARSYPELLSKYGLDEEGIARSVIKFLKERK